MKQIVSSIKLVLLISGLALKGCASFAMVVVTRSRQALPANALQRLSSNTLHVSKKLRSTTSTEKNYRRAAAKIESTSRKERRNNSRSKRDQIIPTNFNIATPVPLSTDKRDPLLKLPSDCVTAKFICRPSKRNRSPYVADIFVPSLDREAICHVPNLDMGGKCFPGVTLLVKPQRDRKGNLLGPDAVSPKFGTPKCEFIAQLLRVDESKLDKRYVPVWVGAHPSLGELLAKEIINRHICGIEKIPGIDDVKELKEQVTIKDGTRSDFVLEQVSGKGRIVEVKTVIDTDYCETWKLPERSKCVFTSKEPYQRKGIFPWGESKQKGPSGEKVVSARAIKHVQELTELVTKGVYDATILFIVIRGDAEVFRPNVEACPSFARYLKDAHTNGVQILAKRVRWQEGDLEGVCVDDNWLDIEWP